MTYRPPTIYQISGCAGNGEDTTLRSVWNCSRYGESVVTIEGTDFGESKATVLLGGVLGLEVKHNETFPHRKLTFRIPSGRGAGQAVNLLQNGGEFGESTISFSYYACPRSRKSVGIDCVPCEEATYTASADLPECSLCELGETAGPAPSYGCTACPPGSKAISQTSITCQLCPMGTAQSASGRDSCTACAKGRFSATVGSITCEDCPRGRYASELGSTACQNCTGLKFQSSTGQTTCQTCPDGQYFLSDSLQVLDETFEANCQACPVGMTCSGADGIVPDPAFFVYADADRVLQAKPCLPGYCEACPNRTSNVANDIAAAQTYSCCTVNRPPSAINPLCGQCSKPDYFLNSGSCVYCVETQWRLVILVLLCTWLYMTVFHSLSQISRSDTRYV